MEFTDKFRYVVLADSLLGDLSGLESLKMLTISTTDELDFNWLAQLRNNHFIEQLFVKVLAESGSDETDQIFAELSLLVKNMRNLKKLRYMAKTAFLEKDVKAINDTGKLRNPEFEFVFENIY